MLGSQQNFSTDPMLASTLLSLELRSPVFDGELPESQPDGLYVDGMDPRFRQLWRGGNVVGLGSEEKDSNEVRNELLHRQWAAIEEDRILQVAC